MVAIKKARRTGRKFSGKKCASAWQTPSNMRAHTRDKNRLAKDLDLLLHTENTKALAEVMGTFIKKHAKPRGQQASGEKGYKELFKTLTARRKKSKKGKRAAYHVPRVRPVNPKLYKMGDGVTQSLIHGFLACRVQLQYVLRGWRRAVSKAAMTYGSIFHDLLEWYYRGIMEGDVDRDTNFRAFAKKHTRRWIKKNAKQLRHAGDLKMALEESAKVCAVFPAYCDFHDEDFDEIEWQELEGVFDIEWKGFRLKGRWDGLYLINGELWLLETKTKSRIEKKLIRDMLAFDFQSLFYITALGERLPAKIAGVRYNVIRNPGLKQSKKESTKKFLKRIAKDAEDRQDFYFMRFESPFDKSDRLAFEGELLAILNEMKDWLDGKLATFKNGGSCIRRYTCDYMSACSSGTMAGYLDKGQLFTELL